MRHDHHGSRSNVVRLVFGLGGLIVAAGAVTAAPGRDKASERGVWYNNSGKGAVEIRPCGASGRDADRLCGFIVWLKEPNNKRGEPLTDGYNSDPGKRHRPICGLPVLGQLRPMSDGSWDQGWVYDPEQGQAFDAAIQLNSTDRLVLTGYKGVKFFSKSFVWKRAPADLPRCDGKSGREASTSAAPATTLTTASAKKAAPARPTQTGALVPPKPVPAVRPGNAISED
jgi:uncharacterized protein (DUF2147 family)